MCSNHFQHRQAREQDPHPSLFLKGYQCHVERVIGRMKDFEILQGPILLSLADIVDQICVVCGALVNLMGILVPLQSQTK